MVKKTTEYYGKAMEKNVFVKINNLSHILREFKYLMIETVIECDTF